MEAMGEAMGARKLDTERKEAMEDTVEATPVKKEVTEVTEDTGQAMDPDTAEILGDTEVPDTVGTRAEILGTAAAAVAVGMEAMGLTVIQKPTHPDMARVAVFPNF